MSTGDPVSAEPVVLIVGSTAVREMAYLEPGLIFIVPCNGDTIYQYNGNRELFDTVVQADSIGRAWAEHLRQPLREAGETAVAMTLSEYEEMVTVQPPPSLIKLTYPPSPYAW